MKVSSKVLLFNKIFYFKVHLLFSNLRYQYTQSWNLSVELSHSYLNLPDKASRPTWRHWKTNPWISRHNIWNWCRLEKMEPNVLIRELGRALDFERENRRAETWEANKMIGHNLLKLIFKFSCHSWWKLLLSWVPHTAFCFHIECLNYRKMIKCLIFLTMGLLEILKIIRIYFSMF